MGQKLDLGHRLELLPADTHCGNISLALYHKRNVAGVPHFLVHTYSSFAGAPERVAFIRQTLITIAGLEEDPESPGWLRFGCGTIHERALKRAFLDLCKLPTGSTLKPKPLTAFDKKADTNLTAVSLGAGAYRINPEKDSPNGPKRAEALARGFIKLCEMEAVEGGANQVSFPCRTSHDPLVGVLMFRAQNVRASMSEEEMKSSRGVLAAPSQQK